MSEEFSFSDRSDSSGVVRIVEPSEFKRGGKEEKVKLLEIFLTRCEKL